MMSTYTTVSECPLFFRQDLPHSAAVTAWKGQPEVELSFQGHKHGVKLPADQIDRHLRHLRKNLTAFLNAKANLGRDDLSIRGYGEMTLRFNGRNEGVCLEDYLCLVSTEKEYAYYAAGLKKAQDVALSAK